MSAESALSGSVPGTEFADTPLLLGRGLYKHYGSSRAWRHGGENATAAVRGVTLNLERGSSLGLVGESGSGKTTVGLMLAGLIAPSEGDVMFEGREVSRPQGVVISPVDRRLIQMVFQDSSGSLNPRARALDTIARTLEGTGESHAARVKRAEGLLLSVGLPRSRQMSFPHELSGGERQRVNIARAIALNPAVVIADEPVASLDVSLQAKILGLLRDLRSERGTSYVFISHDLAVTRYITDEIAVMYAGQVVEHASSSTIVDHPLHPYTRELIAAARGGRENTSKPMLAGIESVRATQGCPYRHRCPIAIAACSEAAVPLVEIAPAHNVACIRAGESGEPSFG